MRLRVCGSPIDAGQKRCGYAGLATFAVRAASLPPTIVLYVLKYLHLLTTRDALLTTFYVSIYVCFPAALLCALFPNLPGPLYHGTLF